MSFIKSIRQLCTYNKILKNICYSCRLLEHDNKNDFKYKLQYDNKINDITENKRPKISKNLKMDKIIDENDKINEMEEMELNYLTKMALKHALKGA